MKEEKLEGKIEDYCVECLKDCKKYDKLNGICPDCHKRIFGNNK